MLRALKRALRVLPLLGAHAVLCILLMWPVIVGRSSLIRPGDSADQSLCWLGKVFGAVRNGELVLWDFSTCAGESFIGELQTSPLYPVALLFGLFSPLDTWRTVDLFLVSHFLLASTSMHACARAMGISRVGAFLAAAVFAYGTTFAMRVGGQPNLFASLAWMPLIVMCAWNAVAVRAPRAALSWSVCAGVALAVCVLAGHVHGAVLGVCAAIIFALHASSHLSGLRERAARCAMVGAVAGIMGLCMAAPQLAATIEYMRLCYKWYGAGCTTYPHIVPFDVFQAASLSVSDLDTVLTGKTVQALDGGTLYFTLTGLATAACALAMLAWYRSSDRRSVSVPAIVLAASAIAFAYPAFDPAGRLFNTLPGISAIRTPARGLFAFAFAMALLSGRGLDSLMVVIAGAENVRRRWRVRMAWICAALAVAAAVIEVTLWLPGRIMTPVRQVPRAVAELFDAPVLKALLELPMEQRSRYRFFARAEDVPPNVADVVPLLSAHGYRSSRTRAFHDYFDFNARSPRADALAIRWWVSDRELPDMRLLKEVAGRFIYERQSAPPVLWQRGGDGRPYDPGIAGITWHANEVDVRFACPVKGQVIFAQVSFPGFQAVADGEPVAVKSADGLMAVDLINPTEALSIRYRPGWLLPSTLLAGGALLVTVVALTSTAVSRVSRSPAADTW